MTEVIDYDDLKKRGFLRQKQEGLFLLRTRASAGIYKKEHLEKLAEIAEKFGKGFIHPTTRQGLEVPFIKFEDIPLVENELNAAGIERGTSGPRLRTVTTCPGNNWCPFGLFDTFGLYKKIEQELNLRCGMDLPHKFKIAISGCANTCTRVQATEIGIHGLPKGFAVYLGGCGGRTPRPGFKLDRVFSEGELLTLIENVVLFFRKNAKPKQRLALLIEEVGKENFLNEILK